MLRAELREEEEEEEKILLFLFNMAATGRN